MKPKGSVKGATKLTILRWTLVLANLVLIAALTSATWDYLYGERNELRFPLPNSDDFDVGSTQKNRFSAKELGRVIEILYYREPLGRPTVITQKAPPEPGPLREWRVSIIIVGNGTPFACIVKRPQERRPRARRPRKPPRIESHLLRVGDEFSISRHQYLVRSITVEPPAVICQDGSERLYTVLKEEVSMALDPHEMGALSFGTPALP